MSETVVSVGILTELIDKLLPINNSRGKKVNEMQSMLVRAKTCLQKLAKWYHYSYKPRFAAEMLESCWGNECYWKCNDCTLSNYHVTRITGTSKDACLF